jgi:hypothetical protein
MSRQRTLTRISGLEGRRVERQKTAIVAKLAAQYDITEVEILAETERIAQDLDRLGLVTFEDQLAHVADDMGITIDELRAEIEQMVKDCR